MKILFILLNLITFTSFARQYPQEQDYKPHDTGHKQYGARSLHHTGRYALTFDDGPHPIRTAKILDLLKEYNAKATFFVLTSNINQKTFPLIKRMLNEGHIVASHGHNHNNSNSISKIEWKSQVKQSFKQLSFWYQKAGYKFKKYYYRFPYAAYGERADYHHLNVLRELSHDLTGKNCLHFAFWDIDSGDWIPGISAQEVASNIQAYQEGGKFITYKSIRKNGKITQVKVSKVINPTSGGVILQHDIQESSVLGTELFLKYARNNGLEIVSLDEVEEFAITRDCQIQ
jgi:peptidoglycan/xylan/chitin deacetylase (PgdA/CDA1 family)